MYELPVEIREETLRLISEENPAALCDAAESLSKRYREESRTGKRLVSGKRDILAYAAARMPATYAAVSRALELSLECCTLFPRSILDVGAGTGAASAAAFALTDCEQITCIEREQCMIEVGESLLRAGGINARWVRGDITDSSRGSLPQAELVLSSYCLNELKPAARDAAVERLWNAAQGALLIVEAGTPAGFEQIKSARKQLMALGAQIAAPCPEVQDCPIAQNDWCHFTVRVARTRLHKQLKSASVPYEDEKFCFILALRGESENGNPDCGKASPCKARILRHPRIDSGKVTLSLCSADGITEKLITRSSPLFKQARKADCGDSFVNE